MPAVRSRSLGSVPCLPANTSDFHLPQVEELEDIRRTYSDCPRFLGTELGAWLGARLVLGEPTLPQLRPNLRRAPFLWEFLPWL